MIMKNSKKNHNNVEFWRDMFFWDKMNFESKTDEEYPLEWMTETILRCIDKDQ